MSMIGSFLAIPSEKLDELTREPDAIEEFLHATVDDQDELGGDFLDVDKAWHGIHFLLTGSADAGEPPLQWAVFAPTEIGGDVGYGPARALTPDQVIEVSKALAPITPDKLKRRCDLTAMNAAEVYPQNWEEGDESYLADNYASLKKFYEAAARRRFAVLQWLT